MHQYGIYSIDTLNMKRKRLIPTLQSEKVYDCSFLVVSNQTLLFMLFLFFFRIHRKAPHL